MITEAVVEPRHCPHCMFAGGMGVSHKKNCACGHHHADHNFAGGCKIKGCKCDCYDQRKTHIHVEPEINNEIQAPVAGVCKAEVSS